jgi:hypothetical protein
VEALAFLSDIPTPIWAALSGGISGVGTWWLSMKKMSTAVERARIKMHADALTEETAERAAFRASLMADIAALRVLMKECDAERDLLRSRVHATEGQILVLKASNEIMERWVAFFKDRNALDPRAVSGVPSAGGSAWSHQ